MRIRDCVSWIAGAVIIGGTLCCGVFAQKRSREIPPEMRAAKTAYFDDRTGDAAVGQRALEELRRWGRYQLVEKKDKADLMLLFSRSPVASAVRGFGSEGVTPRYAQEQSVKSVYLTVIDLSSAEILWGDRHAWGGVLTGENSAGERLVKELEKLMKK
jgi:hypothetical protein